MKNEKQNESQELSVQELASISGGIAEGEPYPSEYPIDDKYNNLSEAIAKHIKDKNLPYWNDKYSDSQTYTSDSSS
ncbi:hypothetical protein [Nostoc sp. MG11]|uniref:hypothetical protein n=1 Tax=Nostoc sp. MG11 TaxID=2721166 RepID=UPI0018676103|nr:hypothetical protein [Nostoc sp. MG11]